jgi:hypothetical protein
MISQTVTDSDAVPNTACPIGCCTIPRSSNDSVATPTTTARLRSRPLVNTLWRVVRHTIALATWHTTTAAKNAPVAWP